MSFVPIDRPGPRQHSINPFAIVFSIITLEMNSPGMSSSQFGGSGSFAGQTEDVQGELDPASRLVFQPMNFDISSPLWALYNIDPVIKNHLVTSRSKKPQLVVNSWRQLVADRLDQESYGEKEVLALKRLSAQIKEGFEEAWERAKLNHDSNEVLLLESLLKETPLVDQETINSIMKPRLEENRGLFGYNIGRSSGHAHLRTVHLDRGTGSDWSPMVIHQLGFIVSWKTRKAEGDKVTFGFSYGVGVYHERGPWASWLRENLQPFQKDKDYFGRMLLFSQGRCQFS